MLLAIIQIYSYLGTTDFALLSVSEISLEYQKYLWLITLCQQQGADRQIKIKICKSNFVGTSRYLHDKITVPATLALPLSHFAPKNEEGQSLSGYCKTIVPFGLNLNSNIHYKPYNNNIKYMVKLPVELESLITRSIIIGWLFEKK